MGTDGQTPQGGVGGMKGEGGDRLAHRGSKASLVARRRDWQWRKGGEMEVEEGFEFTSEMESGQNALPLFFFVCSLFFLAEWGEGDEGIPQ